METNDTTPPSQQPETSGGDTSLGTLLTNVFASPREAFDALARAEVKHMRWVLPLLISLVIVVGTIFMMTSNPTFFDQMTEAQRAAVQEQVEEGNVTQEQADRQLEFMSGNPNTIRIFGSIGGSVFVTLFFFLGALFLWLAGKFVLKADAPYGKYLEVYGLSSWIGIFGAIVTIMLMMGMDTMYASASGALLVLSDYDPVNTTHKLLKSLDVFAVWQAVVVGFGLSAVARKENSVGIGVALVLWVLWVAVSIALGIAR